MADRTVGRSRRRQPRPPAKPFYEGQPTTEEVQQRVVRQARAAVRSVETSRPFTPMDTSRGLFGASQSRGSSGPTRPTSAYSIGRKQFLANLPDTRETLSSTAHRPPSTTPGGTRLAPLPDASNPEAAEVFSLDSPDAGRPTTPRKRALPTAPRGHRPKPPGSATSMTRPASGPAPPASPRARPSSARRRFRTASESSPSGSSPSGGRRSVPQPPANSTPHKMRRSISADKPRVSTAKQADARIWDKVESILECLLPEAQSPNETYYDHLDELHAIITSHPIRSGKAKGTILRSLFRLLDSSDPRLLIKATKTVLQITKTGPTLTNATKLLFKLSRNDANDAIFLEENMAGVLVSVLESSNRGQSTDALVYCCGVIKNTSVSEASQLQLIEAGALHVASSLIYDIVGDPPQAGTVLGQHTSHLLIQLTAALRNLAASDDHRKVFLDAGIIESLSAAMAIFNTDSEMMLNVARIFSKLSLHAKCRAVLSAQDAVFSTLVGLTTIHSANTALVIRVFFVLGNLTANNEDNRSRLYKATRDASLLFQQLIKFIAADQNAGPDQLRSGDGEDGVLLSEDVLIKLVRVIANLCINPDIGAEIACTPSIENLIPLLQSKALDDSMELVMNIIGTLNNLAFYTSEANLVWQRRLEIAECIVSFLLHENMDVVIETARVFGTFTQDPAVRQLLRQHRADELMVVLLEHENHEVVFTVAGVLMNLMADPECRPVLKRCGGIDSLVDVLLNAEVDWQLAGMVCKILWNYSEQIPADGLSAQSCFGVDEAADLTALLAEFLEEDVVLADASPEEARMHLEEFQPVASYLLDRLEDSFDGALPLNGNGAPRGDLEPLREPVLA